MPVTRTLRSSSADPDVWLDARIERVRDSKAHTVRHKALRVACGAHESGRREVIGIDAGEVESDATRREFIRGLVVRGLGGVQPVISAMRTWDSKRRSNR